MKYNSDKKLEIKCEKLYHNPMEFKECKIIVEDGKLVSISGNYQIFIDYITKKLK